MSLFIVPEILNKPDHQYQWGQLYGPSYGLLLRQTAITVDAPLLIVVSGSQEADELLGQLDFFTNDTLPVRYFPDWETLPYDVFSPHQDITSARLEVLSQLPSLKRGLLITTTSTLMQRLAPVEYIQTHAMILKNGDMLDIDTFRTRLGNAGYYAVPQTTQHGEFAVRGSLIDVYPMGFEFPYRIDLFDKEIESIRIFDPESQRTIESVEEISLLPAREFPLDENGIRLFRRQFRRKFEGNPKSCPIYNDISDGLASAGAEYYLPLFFEETATLFDYLPPNTIITLLDEAIAGTEGFHQQIEARYESYQHDITRPVLAPEQLYMNADQLDTAIRNHACLNLQHYTCEKETKFIRNFNTAPIPDMHINTHAEDPASALRQFIRDFHGSVLLTSETRGQREILLDLLRGCDIRPALRESWHDFITNPAPLCLTVSDISTGMILKGRQIAIISDQQILSQRTHQLSGRRRRRDAGQVFTDLVELHIGSPVVHEGHGIGRYLGLQTLHVNGYDEEFLALEYAGNNRLYVPVASLHLINRYSGGPEETAPLHHLGGEQWARVKRKATQRIRDIATELLDIYARREARPGYSHILDHVEYDTFAESFPFEETEDQLNAINSVIEDLQSGRPMDRVVCGDVGFGKTEVAMRAAFVATQSGKQVAILVPTTLLTQQHLQNFRDRFADWPIKVEALSRFRSTKEASTIIKQLKNGEIDIIIGTHKLLQKSMQFKDLGLLIIDEEHRFGVHQKEKIKKLRSQVDILTLTATPIPRTLNMSLSGLRDLSIIATPPMQRLSVKTFVNEWRDQLIQEACLREIKRGGQVYLLHNDISTIEKTAGKIRELIPEARVEIAHGQMRERKLEQIMLDFYHRKYNVLVCTTIIESGIDVPTANTILMNHADKFGLAQLHQLRGRVGRSHHQAYAYLIIPPRKTMTADAIKRIEAVESLEDLGAGFSLASHDLEIRGSGELLGEEQSGQITEIGYAMYTDLLKRAVSALKSGKIPELDQPLHQAPEINLHIPALLPNEYLPDVHTRLIQYKRIANAEDKAALKDLRVEMIDRFGLLPDAANNLFALAELKIQSLRLGILKITANNTGARIVFDEQPNVDINHLVELIRQSPDIYRFDGKNKFRLHIEMPEAEDRFNVISQLLTQLDMRKAA